MIAGLIEWTQSLITPLGGIGVFIASVIEEVIVVIPSAAVQMASGFLLFEGVPVTPLSILSFVSSVALPAAFGVTLGSLLVYYLTLHLGKVFIDRYGKWFALSWATIERFKEQSEKKHADVVIVFVGRTLPVLPSATVSAFAGLIRMRLWPYVITTFLGTLVRSVIYGFIGWQVGNVYVRFAQEIENIEKTVLISAGVVTVGYLVWRRKTRLKKKF